MELKDFFEAYLTQLTDKQKLAFVEAKMRTGINSYTKEEIALLSVFIDLLNGNPADALKNLKERQIKKSSRLGRIGYGLIYLNLGQRSRNLRDAVKAVAYLKKAADSENGIPFLYLRLARAYRSMEYLSDKEKDETKKYEKSRELLNKTEGMLNNSGKAVRSYIYNEYGDIYMKMRNYEMAKAYYEKAKADTIRQPFSHIGIGNVLRNQNELYAAIQSYKESLRLFGKISKGAADNVECTYPLNYIGDCYRYAEDYPNAKKKYNEAIKVNPEHAFPWNGLGRVYYELGNRNNGSREYYKQAETYFRKAISLNGNFKYAIYNLGRVYERLKDYNQAISCYQEALKKPPYNEYWEDRIGRQIEEVKNKERLEQNLKILEQIKYLNALSVEESVIARSKLNEIEERVFLKKNSFSETFLKEKYYIPDEDIDTIIFEVLRRWNSYTPIIADGSKGGGYFVRAFGKGIVIDPGFNFIENFIEAKYQFADIDIVLISHAHDDHTADLESIINLLYRYNKELKESKLKRQIAKETCIPNNKIDEKWKVLDARFKKYKKRLSLYVSEGVMKKYEAYFKHENCCILDTDKNVFDENSTCGYGIRALTAGKVVDLSNETRYGSPQIKIESLMAKHDDIIKDADKISMPSLGFKLDFGETVLIYTGDTGWSDELDKQYREIKEDCDKKGQYVILLAHIGGFDKAESKLIESIELESLSEDRARESMPYETLKEMLYDKHLGRLGLVKINEALEPDLCIISEFGEEFKGFRVDITRIFNDAFARNKTGRARTFFLPADIGLKIKIKESKAKCPGTDCPETKCSEPEWQNTNEPQIKVISRIDRENRRFECDYVDPKEVEVGEYLKANKLFYYKKGVGINKSDCLQAFFEDFGEDCCKIDDCMEHMVCQRRKK